MAAHRNQSTVTLCKGRAYAELDFDPHLLTFCPYNDFENRTQGWKEKAIEEVITAGTRIRDENIVAASPISTITEEEISLKQTPNIERVFRDMPITIPGDASSIVGAQ